MIWPWTWRRELLATKDHAGRLDRSLREAQLHMDVLTKSRDEWKTRYLSVNDKFSERAAHLSEARVRLELTTKENDRLRAELLDAVMLSKTLIDKIGIPAPAKDPHRHLAAQDDPFAEQSDQASVFVDRPGSTPAEIGEDIAAAFTK